MPTLDDGTPLFVQIAEQLADDIVDGVLAEATRLGIDTGTLVSLIQGPGWHNGGSRP